MATSHARRPRSRSRGAPLAFGVGAAAGATALLVAQALLPPRDPDLELLRSARDLALRHHVGPELDGRQLVDEALRGMIDGLDPYSRYYPPGEVAALERETRGSYHGIGVVFRPPVAEGLIRFALPGSPAELAGVRPGDRIVSVDGDPLALLGEEGLRSRLGQNGEHVLVLEHSASGQREVRVSPEYVIDPSVRHARMVAPELGIGYLAVRTFTRATPKEFDQAAAELRALGMLALVLDLRGNPGGLLESAADVVDRFVAEGAIVTTRTRREERTIGALAERTHLAGMPLVVLVDAGSASASEVAAAALQDHRAAVVVGEATYGKGVVQSLHDLDGGRARVKLTSSVYVTPAGRRITRPEDLEGAPAGGVVPDLVVPRTAAERREVLLWLAGYSPPAGGANGDLDADEPPPPDRQLDAAIELLAGRLPGPTVADAGR